MSIALVTGSGGLIGAEAVRRFAAEGYDVVGVDNDMRRAFFGDDASTTPMIERLVREVRSYRHHGFDIRDGEAVEALVASLGDDLGVVVHTAAQPSHDWAARDPATDFGVNAVGTLNLLEACRRHAPEAVFVFTSTNKVYGDLPNTLPLVEHERRLDLPEDHPWYRGIPVEMSIDRSTHSLFGVSKASADLLVQEYGRYFGMRTVCFRGGCLTGPGHAGTELHGFLSFLMRCTITGQRYTVYGYGGKQVRDNIHSRDLVDAFVAFVRRPQVAAVYNIGGGRASNCSMAEAIEWCQELTGRRLDWVYEPRARVGDHRWWISDLGPFERDYPEWRLTADVPAILAEIRDLNAARWRAA